MLTEQNKMEIYQVLTGKFQTNVLYPLAEVGRELTLSGNGCRKFSYARMTDLLGALSEYIILQDDEEEQGKYLVKILPWNAPAEKEQDPRPFTREVKEEIYRTLCSRFAINTKIHMASISKYLIAGGYTPKAYGFTKMKNMLAQMDGYLEMEDVVINQVPNVLITILKDHPDQENKALSSADRAESRAAEKRASDNMIRSSSGSGRFSGKDTGSTFKEPAAAPEKPKPRRTEGNTNFERLVYMPPKVIEFLNRKGMTDPGAVLSRSYAKSVSEQTFEQRGVMITFPVEWERGGDGMVAIIKKNEKPYGKQWFLTYVGFPKLDQEVLEEEEAREEMDEDLPVTPGKALEAFAEIGYWQEFLHDLAELAVSEKWESSNKKLGRYYVLKKYIQYTFYRLQQEDKVMVSSDGQFAAFNSGLVTAHYDEIYVCFVPNPESEKAEWKFEGFVLAGIRGNDESGKKLASYFDPLPYPAEYIGDPSELFFDFGYQLEIDYARLILEHMGRLPIGYLRECAYGDEEAQKMLEVIENAKSQNQLKQAYFSFSRYLSVQDKIYRRLKSRMEDAIEMAMKRVRWNYRTVIPCYDPKDEKLSLMLPLCLEDDTHTDAALVLERDTASGVYRGISILTLDQAYLEARLIGQPGPNWLGSGEEERG